MKTPDEMERESAAAIAGAGVPDETMLRESKEAWPKTEEELLAAIRPLVDRPHSYGTCVYAMSLAAVAAFNYVAGRLGVTGFQASCADMDIIRRTRSLKGPFGLLDANDLLYPQYDIRQRVEGWIREWRPWAADEARKLLAQRTEHAHPDVIAHWRRLAAGKEPADGEK